METKKPKTQQNESAQKIAELTDTLQRLQAEFENYKKRAENEKEEFKCMASECLIKELLPLLDSFELALKSAQNSDEFLDGIKLIFSQFVQTLENHSLKKIEALNQPFDPYLHEAILTAQSEKDNIVLEELQKGYTLNNRVLRHSMVKVGKNDNNKTNSIPRNPENCK